MYYETLADELLHIRANLLRVPAHQKLSNMLCGELFVLNYLHDGAATGSFALYQWQNGQLVQLARASMLTPDADITSDKLHAKAERLISGAWQTVYDETFDFDEAAWQMHYDAILGALWDGVNPGEGQQLVPELM